MNPNNQYESLFSRYKGQNATTVFAFFPRVNEDWDGCFKALIGLARIKGYESCHGDNVVRLKNYLNHTFLKLQEEEKILYSDAREWACFNTGLQTHDGKDIVASFRRNAVGGARRVPAWVLDRFWDADDAYFQNFGGERPQTAKKVDASDLCERKSGLCAVGYTLVRCKDSNDTYKTVPWIAELARLSGQYVDKTAIDEFVDKQLSEGKSYRYCNGELANSTTADMQVFDTGLRFAENNKPIFARFLRGRRPFKWLHLTFVDADHIAVPEEEIPNDDFLFRFAYMPISSAGENWMEDLKSKVLEEDWSFGSRNDNGMLKQYLKQMYLRSRNDGCVIEKEGVGAAFDTGLVNRTYDQVYAYFVPNQIKGVQPWKLKGFCVKGADVGKKMIEDLADKFVEGVRWFDEDPKRLYFEPNADVVADEEHCMVERAFRLPLELWQKILSGNEQKTMLMEWSEIQSLFGSDSFSERASDWCRALKQSESYDSILQDLKKELDHAIKFAQKKVRWDYTTAVPIYYPRKRNFAFLLPLSFGHDKSKVDCALVVQRLEKNEKTGRWLYQGQTILTPSMAYNDARLLKRPDVSWLRQVVEKVQKFGD